MIEIFLLCLIATVADNCETIHPPLDQLIPRDLLPPDESLIIPSPISYSTTTTVQYIVHNNNKVYNK